MPRRIGDIKGLQCVFSSGQRVRRVGLLFNPISGAGRSRKIASALAATLRERGYEAILQESRATYDQAALREFLGSLDALLVVGGDGTIRALLEALGTTGTPVYLVPAGNESLFARHFGMTRSPHDILAALAAGRISEATIAQINDSFYFSMASLGFDSLVVGKIARHRRGPIGHIGYVKPTLQSIVGFKAPQLKVLVDGKPLIDGEAGFVIAANTDKYARNLGLVPEACGTKELVHVRFFPYRSLSSYLPWLWNLAVGKPVSLKNTVYRAGQQCSIMTAEGSSWPIQADGDYIGESPALVQTMVRRLKVLRPK